MNNVVCFGEILLRLNAPNHQRFTNTNCFEAMYSGSEANVAVLLSQLNILTTFVSKVPDNDMGTTAIQTVRALGVTTSSMILGGNRLGIYFTEIGAGARPSRVVYDRTGSSFAELKPGELNWDSIFEGKHWFHWSGISAAVSQSAADVCAEAITVAKKKNMTISVDFNHRSKLWQYEKKPSEIMPQLLASCDVITCDFDSLKLYLDIEQPKSLSKEEAFKLSCGAIKEKLPNAKTIAMSFRETSPSGADLYTGAVQIQNAIAISKAYSLGQVVDRIGSGDAFMAGLIFSLIQKWEPARVAQYAAACGVLKHTMPGDFTLLNQNEIETFLNTDIRGKIIR